MKTIVNRAIYFIYFSSSYILAKGNLLIIIENGNEGIFVNIFLFPQILLLYLWYISNENLKG